VDVKSENRCSRLRKSLSALKVPKSSEDRALRTLKRDRAGLSPNDVEI
jgi:hypothetical protein